MAHQVIGIGTDLIKVERVSRAYERFGISFVRKILHPIEIEIFDNLPASKQVISMAKYFAVKESVMKSLGRGWGVLSFTDIILHRNSMGEPSIYLEGGARRRAEEIGVSKVLITLSDEQDFVVAFATATGK